MKEIPTEDLTIAISSIVVLIVGFIAFFFLCNSVIGYLIIGFTLGFGVATRIWMWRIERYFSESDK